MLCDNRLKKSEFRFRTKPLCRHELHRDTVDTITEIRRRWTVIKDMSKMTPAGRAMHLGPHHAITPISRRFHRPLDRIVETGPPRPTLEFSQRFKQRLIPTN